VITWFGGEPLLAMDVVEDVQRQALDLQLEHPEISVSGSMTTNGYLLSPQKLSRLTRLGVSRFQVTVDGAREFHDQRRVRSDGQGTFDRVWSNLEAARGLPDDFEIKVRMHVDAKNLQEVERLLETCKEVFGGDPRFVFFVRNLFRWGAAKPGVVPGGDQQQEKRRVAGLRQKISSLGLRQHRSGEPGYVCYAARGNSFVIRSNGEVAKCTVALSHPENRVGLLHEDGHLELDGSKMFGWIRGVFSKKPEELACPMKGHAEPSTHESPLAILSG
jgi:uncharacterized protein